MKANIRGVFLAGAAVAFSPAAHAATGDVAHAATGDAAQQATLETLERQVQELSAQIQQLKQAQALHQTSAQNSANAAVSPVQPQPLTAADAGAVGRPADKKPLPIPITAVADKASAQPKVSIDNGRLNVASADGRFTAALRGMVQYDSAYYSQTHAASLSPAAYGPDLGSGSSFRRVWLGLSGHVFGDWTYNINLDFGGSGGTEIPGHIQSVYVEYDGLAPWGFRIGAYPPPVNVEDSGSTDPIFLERSSPSNMMRNIAGGEGRDSISILYMKPTVFGAVSFTGNKVADGAKALAAGAAQAANFDEQESVVGRLSWLPIANAEAHWLVGVNGTYVIKPPDLVSNGLADLSNTPGASPLGSIALSDPPQLAVDSNGINLANTAALNADHLTQWGVETAGNWRNFYGQAGYYNFALDRTAAAFATPGGTSIVKPRGDTFGAWYALASWVITGEQHIYNPATGAFYAPRPDHPFGLDGSGLGAFEVAARYSDLNLNDHVGDPASIITAASGASRTYDFYNTVRGGDQRIVELGLNWYPNSVIRFTLDYQLVQLSRLQSGASPNPLTGITATTSATPVLPGLSASQNLQTVALRAQLSL